MHKIFRLRKIFSGALFCAALSLALLLAAAPALADPYQTVISDARPGSVYGNSGDGNLTGLDITEPRGNILTIASGGSAGINAYGAYVYSLIGLGGSTYLPISNSVHMMEPGVSVGANVYGSYVYATGQVVAYGGVRIEGAVTGGDVYGVYVESADDDAEASGKVLASLGSTSVGGDMYGGYAKSITSGKTAKVSGCDVQISYGSTVTGNVFGGFCEVTTAGVTGSATGNYVSINNFDDFGGSPTIGGAVYGGFVGNFPTPVAGADAFTGNNLSIMNGSTPISLVKNFEIVSFSFASNRGDANIATLDTSPGGSSRPGVQVITSTGFSSYNVVFNGKIIGDGDLIKKGLGELTLTDVSGLTGDIILYEYEGGSIRNSTSGPITVKVKGVPRVIAVGATTDSPSSNPNPNPNPNPSPNPTPPSGKNWSSGGCDAGLGLFGLLALSAVAAVVSTRARRR
jgi:hypothetical protein